MSPHTPCLFLLTGDTGLYYVLALTWFDAIVLAMIGVIMIARLHAMYQGSKKVLIFLVVIFLVVNIFGVIFMVIVLRNVSAEEVILSGTYQCTSILTLCLASWIAVKHFRELRRHGPSIGSTIIDCFTVLIKSHVIYFASFVAVSCLFFVCMSPALSTVANALSTHIYIGIVQICLLVQYFVLGPRLILSVREYHAGLVIESDTASAMPSIAFQEHVYVATCSSV
ncbi:hypothetical protein BDR07DRAFT_1423985 [Suillus spraguei]|nr:hypothetical protein BDR07DRAFT_1423985 [Suillus spraguei]